MRNILKACTFVAALSLCVFGAYTLRDQIYPFLPQESIDAAEIIRTDTPELPDENRDIPPFTLPELLVDGESTNMTNNLVFVHGNGFEVGKSRYQDATATPDVKYNNRQQLYRFSIAVDPDSIISYDIHSTDTPTAPRIFAKDAPAVALTDYTWSHAVQPYLTALTEYVSEYKTPVVLIIECRYKSLHDIIPQYIDMKAFSQNDLGKQCNFWVTFYNTDADPRRQLNYTDNTWMTVPAAPEGGDRNGQA